jgi:hypothetical protein
MNRERAINILLEHAIRSTDSNDDAYAPDDSLTAAIIFIQREIQKNKIDAKIQIKGITSKVTKGV